VLEATSTEAAPWTLVDGSDRHRRALAVGDTLLAAMRGPARIERAAFGATRPNR